jgi:multidrug efflux pump subunit AcrA (membrane-fusion protein)
MIIRSTIVLVLIVLIGCKNKTAIEVETCNVKNGLFYIDLVEEGEIQATNSINISVPAMSWQFGLFKITQIVEDGDLIQSGDTAVIFDPSEVEKAIINANAELEIAKAELEKKKAEQASKIEELKANIEISEISHRISEINLEQATFEADITRREIKLNLEKAKIALDKAREEIENQQKIHSEEIKQSMLKISQLESNLREAEITFKNLTVVSPAAGIAILRKNWSTGNKWQVGDQPWSGSPLVDLPDLQELKVHTEISEVDISKIQMGQAVEIKLDAFSDTAFSGKVISIANLAQFKEGDSKIKIFPVEILIDGTSEKFLPGMTVSCRIIVDKIDSVLYIPLEALFVEGDKNYVYDRSGNSYRKKDVVIGQRNNDFVIIREGLDPDAILALSDPYPEKKRSGK